MSWKVLLGHIGTIYNVMGMHVWVCLCCLLGVLVLQDKLHTLCIVCMCTAWACSPWSAAALLLTSQCAVSWVYSAHAVAMMYLDPVAAALCCSLPAAAALNNQQVLDLFKAAAKYDGVQTATPKPDNSADGSDDDDDDEDEAPTTTVLPMFKQLVGQLSEQGVVELLQMAAHNK